MVARAMGLGMPLMLLAHADEVIEQDAIFLRREMTRLFRTIQVLPEDSRGLLSYRSESDLRHTGATMRRREFIVLLGSTAVWPAGAGAEPTDRVRHIGVVNLGAGRTPASDGLLEGMRDRGYTEGRNFVVDWRFAEGKLERLPELVTDLVRLKVDIILLTTAAVVPFAQQATTTIPIVMLYSVDPVGNGFIKSLARPGGNTTGLASALDDIVPKHFELLATVLPRLNRVGLLANPMNPNTRPLLSSARTAAARGGFNLIPLEARNLQEIESAFAAAAKQETEAVIVEADAVFAIHRQRVAELAVANRLPSMFSQREYVQAGGLMSYGESLADLYRQVTYFVDKIFKGTKPSELPVQQPTRFHLTVSLKTAKALGLTIEESFLWRADEVIE
jgi:putative ABC transport system substrate-binding protein